MFSHSHRLSAMKATSISLFMTFWNVFDVPVFWPILVLYFFALFFLTMKRQIMHMRKHGYLPWSTGKKTWNGKKEKLNKPSGNAI